MSTVGESMHRLQSVIIHQKNQHVKQIQTKDGTAGVISYRGEKILLISVYLSHRLKVNQFNQKLDELKNLVQTIECDLTVIGGDFNADTLNSASAALTSCKGRALIAWIDGNNFMSPSCGNESSSFKDKTGLDHRLDHLIIKSKHRVSFTENKVNLAGCDHNIFQVHLYLECPRIDSFTVKFAPNKLNNVPTFTNIPNVNALEDRVVKWEKFLGKRKIIIKKHSETKKETHPLYNVLFSAKNPPQVFVNTTVEKIRYMNDLERKKKLAELRQVYKKSPWKGVKMIVKSKIKDLTPVTINEKFSTAEVNRKVVMKEFKRHVKKIQCFHETHDPIIIEDEKIINYFKQNKKHSKLSLSSTQIVKNIKILSGYVELIKTSFTLGHFPKEWSVGWTTLIPKSDLVRWRQIVSQHPASTVIQKIIYEWLREYIEDNKHDDLLPQYGFICERSIRQLIYKIMIDSTEYVTKGMIFLVGDVDVNAAFDSLPHDKVETILNSIHLPTNVISLIMCYIKNFRMITQAEGSFVYKRIDKGVPQGSVIGPAIWIIFTAFILRELKKKPWFEKVKLYMFADDIKILTADTNIIMNIHIVLNDIEEVLSELGLSCNKNKTKIYVNREIKYFTGIMSSLNLKLSSELQVFGLKFTTTAQAKKRIPDIRKKLLTLVDNASPFCRSLLNLHHKAPILILRTCIFASISHLLPAITHGEKLDNIWSLLYEIEASFCHKGFKKGWMSQQSMPIVYTQLECKSYLKSEILSMCYEYRDYADHSLFKDFPEIQSTSAKLYDSSHYHSERVSISESDLPDTDHILIKVNGSSKSLQFIFREGRMNGQIMCHDKSSNFDVLRLGIDGLILFSKSLGKKRIQIVTCDQSLLRINKVYKMWHDSSESIITHLKILPGESKQGINTLFYNVKSFKVTIKYEKAVGKTSLSKMLDETLDEIAMAHWNRLRIATTSRISYRLWREMIKSKFPIKKLGALRFMRGFLYNSGREYCSCPNRSLFHLITECDDLLHFRLASPPELQTYLEVTRLDGQFKETKDREILEMFITYLYSLFQYFLKEIQKNQPQ